MVRKGQASNDQEALASPNSSATRCSWKKRRQREKGRKRDREGEKIKRKE